MAKSANAEYTDGREHLEKCPGCDECNWLLSLYTACHECGHWMWNECEHYWNENTGIALCGGCEPKEKHHDQK